MKTKKTAFVAVMWLTAFGLLGAPTTPAVDILPTVGGQAHAWPAISPWWVKCPAEQETDLDPWQQILADAYGANVLQMFGITGYEAVWICRH